MQKYFNNVVDKQGQAIVGASVAVTVTSGSAAAVIYTGNGTGLISGNSITTDASGFFQFYASDNRYTLTITGQGIASYTLTDILLEDPVDGSPVSVKAFGAVGDGVTNDSAAFLAAATSLGAKGGTVRYFDKHLIDTSFTLPKNVTLQGPMGMVGSPGDNGNADYGPMAALIINSAATITLASGAGHDGGLVYRKGMVFPTPNASAFAGDAFTSGGEDNFLTNSLVGGFNRSFYLNNHQRPRIFNNWFDNQNGIEIAVCFDIAYVHHNHAWPFFTIAAYAQGGAVDKTLLHRTGIAYYFRDGGDWNKSTNNFSYGYFRGHKLLNVNSMTVLGAAADNTQIYAGSIGIEVSGSCNGTRIIAQQGAAQATAIYINTTAGLHTEIQNPSTWVNSANGILIDGGDVSINGGNHRNTPKGININNAASAVYIDGARFNATTEPISNTTANTKVFVGTQNNFGDLVDTSFPVTGALTLPTLASGASINFPANGDAFVISGSTNFGSVGKGYARRKVTMFFTGTPTVLHATSFEYQMRLSGGVNFVATVGATLTIQHNGVQWYEVGRST